MMPGPDGTNPEPLPPVTNPGPADTRYLDSSLDGYVAAAMNKALTAVANPMEGFRWTTSVMTHTELTGGQVSQRVQGYVTLICPSPILGEGCLVSLRACDLLGLADEATALGHVRGLVENLRALRSQLLQ